MPPSSPLKMTWHDNQLTIFGDILPGGQLELWYMEAFCRPGSGDRDWAETVIPHQTTLLDGQGSARLRLESVLADGVRVRHTLTAGADEVDFRLEAANPTEVESRAHWAQPCIRVGSFTGYNEGPEDYREGGLYAYLEKCFVFIDGKEARLPTRPWATQALYTPGQVWLGPGVPPEDVDPRPLSELTPSCGLIGCYSGTGERILATAWEPYQELFQGIFQCIHADFRIGGLPPGATRQIRGKLYLVENDLPALLERYAQDFPEHLPSLRLPASGRGPVKGS